ncbi:MAG: aromatic amino acid aminotransferase [Cellvibrionaceae bacterium]|nr:aromatic amino acid aminotransferase [Cellvibrionaceae bacterium]|tara:strand:- start:18329 stop:19570 length:1242 start_codon:yes stop_codon:yes gene_type:complete
MNAKVELAAVSSHVRLLGQNQSHTQEDPIFELLQAFRKDQREHKIDLGIGVYRDDLNRSPVFEAIKQAEQWRVDNESDKAYVGPLGDMEFCQAITQLAFGDELAAELQERCSYAQTPGGVGALRLAFELLEKSLSRGTLWVSDTTWQVHRPIAAAAGLALRDYRYYRADEGAATFDQLLASLEQAAPGDGILLQVSCHNPTGLDFTEQQWHLLAEFCLDRQLFPILDMAYHGLGQGLAGDRRGLEIMAAAMPELLLCYTCSKNFGLYRDRTGMVLALTDSPRAKVAVDKQWAQLATRHYFTPPAHGAMLVKRILNDRNLRAAWEVELNAISQRIGAVRQQLFDALATQIPGRNWQFLTRGHGMFALFPLSQTEITALRDDYGLYIVNNGRVNLSGFNPLNLDRAIEAMVAVLA